MGGGLTKQELVARLDALDREEIEINRELRQLQIQLNQIVPEEEKIEVKPLEGEENEKEIEEINEKFMKNRFSLFDEISNVYFL